MYDEKELVKVTELSKGDRFKVDGKTYRLTRFMDGRAVGILESDNENESEYVIGREEVALCM